MEKHKPKYYIETRFEKTIRFSDTNIMSYQYAQPVDYCNGRTYYDYDPLSYERINWGNLYWESKWFNDVLTIVRYNDPFWVSEDVKNQAFEKVFLNKSKGEGVYVPIQDFEIYLMNKGYEMRSFDKMCSQSPGFQIGKQETGYQFGYSRFYGKNGKYFYFAFGIENDYVKFNFYFVCSEKQGIHYQVPVSPDQFEAAENLDLISFEELSKKQKQCRLI